MVLTESAVPLPNPTGDRNLLQLSPVWLTTGKGPILAWLEGGDLQRLAVRSARWSKGKWVEYRTVAPAGPGSQLALIGRDFGGRPTLLWSAFDGHDDEILWSRLEPSKGGRWSRPQRVTENNDVPDLTPTIAVRGGKLHAAWAHYDGEVYRVVSSTFDGLRWSRAAHRRFGRRLEPALRDRRRPADPPGPEQRAGWSRRFRTRRTR